MNYTYGQLVAEIVKDGEVKDDAIKIVLAGIITHLGMGGMEVPSGTSISEALKAQFDRTKL